MKQRMCITFSGPLLYADEELDELCRTRDPVLPAQSSPSAQAKKATHQTEEGTRLRSWSSLLQSLSTLCRNTCRMKDDPTGSSFVVETQANDLQSRAQRLMDCVQCDEVENWPSLRLRRSL